MTRLIIVKNTEVVPMPQPIHKAILWYFYLNTGWCLYYKNESNAFLSIIVIGRFKGSIHQAASVRIKIGLGTKLGYFSGIYENFKDHQWIYINFKISATFLLSGPKGALFLLLVAQFYLPF